ncbi:hypothetical protein SLEP1_g43644 [Rubroshorea leprosula]|uniref:Uncharacterized protein n=1 Tax=Rubroshorea leprosula TaxID=152421 RepID=A0AAV5LDP0_9ROSI|nr:hypothetical protein SLEP1_g43644 [Rubroshorea leprosula]
MSSSQCFENPPSKTTTCGAGYVEEFAGLNTYITGPPDSKRAILLISDVFGYEAPNLRYGWIHFGSDYFELLGIIMGLEKGEIGSSAYDWIG